MDKGLLFQIAKVKKEIEDIIGIPAQDAPCISAKSGLNVDQVLERIVTDLPAPTGDETAPLKALIFDSIYDNYKGAIAYVRIKDGTVKVGDEMTPAKARQARREGGPHSSAMQPTEQRRMAGL